MIAALDTPQSKLLSQSQAGLVANVDPGKNCLVRHSKCDPAQHSCSSFCRIAAAPHILADAPTDLELAANGAANFPNFNQSAKAN